MTAAGRNALACRGEVRSWAIFPDGSYRLGDFAEPAVGIQHDSPGLASVLGFLLLPAGQAEADPLGEDVRERGPASTASRKNQVTAYRSRPMWAAIWSLEDAAHNSP